MQRTRLLLGYGAVIVTAMTLTSPVFAQGPGIGFGASVGANIPEGDYADGAKTGLVATGFLALRMNTNVALRGELFWSRSDLDNAVVRKVGDAVLPEDGIGNVTGDVDLVGGLANLEVSAGSSILRPYAIGGVGVYRRRVAQDVEGAAQEFRDLKESDSKFGWNAGAGLKLSLAGFGMFLEARYHSVSTEPKTNFIPVTVGISF